MYRNIFRNKKTIKYSALVLMICAIMLNPNIKLFAGAVDDSLSYVDVTFTEGDATIGPIDPENPVDPDPETGGGEGGSLALNFISDISFGTKEISAYKETYPSITPNPYLQLTDLRGTGKGWNVSARSSTFINDGRVSLQGATIKFTPFDCIPLTEGMTPPTAYTVELPADGSTKEKFVVADEMEGMGTWFVKWYTDPDDELNDSVELNVLSGTGMEGANTATITWYLEDVPNVEEGEPDPED